VFFTKIGIAAGNGLNDATPFVGGLWAADLEDDVEDINGRGRDYVLTAWYKHAFDVEGVHPLEVTLGIIDSTDYLDTNAYAHDEYTQFMNPFLVTARSGFYPSYDYGAAVTLKKDWLDLRGVVMNVGENEAGNSYNFMGLHLGYEAETRLGKGDYRLVLSTTSRDYRDPRHASAVRQQGLVFSFDQELGDLWGGFLRLGWTNVDTSFPFRGIYSAGLDVSGKPWKRPRDNLGIGYAYLVGANQGVDRIHVAEAYYRFVMVDNLALTGDLQYLDETRKVGKSPRGWVFGLRAVANF
jgi:porin